MTLPELMVGVGVGGIFLTLVAIVFVGSTQSFALMQNHYSMDDDSRRALDQMTQDIRKAGNLVSFSTNELVFTYAGSNNLVYHWDPATRQLIQWKSDSPTTNVLLNGCDSLRFSMFRNVPVIGGAATNAATVAQAKCISVSWECSRTVVGQKLSTENMQQALIVIRNKPVL
jgi:Tfp pilus assembly protein PilW